MLILIYEEIQNDNKQKQKNLSIPLSFSTKISCEIQFQKMQLILPIYQLSLTWCCFTKSVLLSN